MREHKKNKSIGIIEIVKGHIGANKKEYITISIIFLVGIVLGVMLINQVSETNSKQIQDYLTQFIEALKTDYTIDQGIVLKNALVSNLIFALILWFMGSTVVGIPIVYGIVATRGLCIGYTISSIFASMELRKSTTF